MSYMKCCVPGCSTATGTQTLHNFPNPAKDLERFRSWLYIIGGDILALPNEYIFKNRRICRSHFEKKYCCRFNRISNIAIPTVNMPGLSILKFLHDTTKEQQPLKQRQNFSESVPSTSKDALFGTDMSVQPDFTSKSEKENVVKHAPSTHGVDNIPIENISFQNISTPESKTTEIDADKDQTKKIFGNMPSGKRTMCQRTGYMRMTEAEKKLYSKLVSVSSKLSKYRSKIKKQALEITSAKKIFSNPAFVKVMESMPKSAKVLTLLQFRESTKKEKGRRFNIDEKIVALSILKQSPKAYRFLRKIFLLPSPQTLIKLLAKANVKAGINKKVFAQLKTRVTQMKIHERLCILLFDEMSLKANVTYNERKDKVTGFVTNGTETRPIFANHAQVFMIRGLVNNYKHPVAYTFSSGATKGPELAKQLKEVIRELHKAGLQVMATVCDQGANNRHAIKSLMDEARGIFLRRGDTPKEHVFIVDDKEIVPLYDPPHLLKGIRNNLLTKNLQYEMDGKVKIAKWHHLELFHKENPGYKGMRLVAKLTDSHIVPHKIGKMKVKYASQVFSATVASNMGYLAEKGILPSECVDTADLLLFIDKLFDSVNGSYTNKRFSKPLLAPVTPKSCHHKTWSEAKKILKSMVFINGTGKKEVVPTINNWMWTLEGIQVLLRKLNSDFNISSVWMRHLNQDPIENFFGAIRSHGCRNTNPTAERFESAYTTLLVNNLTSVHAPGGNCESDLGEILFTLVCDEGSKAADDDATGNECEVDLNDILNIELEPIEIKKRDPKILAPLQYISGYFVHKTKKIYKQCEICKTALENNEEIEYIRYREYAGRRWLCSPSDSIVNIISNYQDVIIAILKKDLEKPNLKLYIQTLSYMLIDFKTISCENHKDKLLTFMTNLVTRFFIYNYCKDINRILCGKKEIYDVEDKFQIMAKEHLKKCLKK